MFNLFRKQPPQLAWICINGNAYFREESKLKVIRFQSKKIETCDSDHIAPNGVTIQQIACALAAAEGAISILSVRPAMELSSQFNGVN